MSTLSMFRVDPLTGEPDLTTIYTDNNEAVATLLLGRLKLWLGQWYLDTSLGIDWYGSVMGYTQFYDLTIQTYILQTTGITNIVSYSSTIVNRVLTVTCTCNTIFSKEPITVSTSSLGI